MDAGYLKVINDTGAKVDFVLGSRPIIFFFYP
jgi:hypothetical protein